MTYFLSFVGACGFSCLALLAYAIWESRANEASTRRFIEDLDARAKQQREAQIEHQKSIAIAPIPWDEWDRSLSLECLEVRHEPYISQQANIVVETAQE